MSLSSNRPGGPATAPRVPESSSDPLIGQTLGGKYAVVRLIGRGGVGLVYLARHAERDVVVKVLSPHWADDAEALARFDREAKRLAGLHHPNVVEMLDFGRDGDRAYLVMEYLRGELLSDFVSRKRRLSLEEFVPIAAQILKGIGHAHSREVMVRDVKPANIMLCERKGRANFVKILDFGLAKLLRGEQAITEEHVMGTVGYLAPEAIRGEPLDLRVDVYAIGVLFYYMLAGRLPFEGESNAAVFYKTIHEPPRPLGEVVGAGAALPPGLIELVHQCLEKDREQRPADADRVVERLIDVVPASLFRLPRTTTERHGGPVVVPPGVGNTGLIELLGNGRNETVLEPRSMTPIPGTLRPVVSVTPEPATATATSANEAMRTTAQGLEPAPVAPRTMGLVAASVAAGAALTVLVVGAVVMMLRNDDSDARARTAATAPQGPAPVASGKPAPSLVALLDDADAKIGRGELDAAAGVLGQARSLASDDVAALDRIGRAESRIAIARLAASAAESEAAGNDAAALASYREILAADPDHAQARAAVARLTAATPQPPADPAVTARFVIQSRPVANLTIDGRAAGTTPFDDALGLGRHSVRISARGYAPWEGTIDVASEGNVPLSVQLRGKGPGRSDEPDTPTTTPTPTPTPDKPTPPGPGGGETPPPASGGTGKKDPFLPTKKGDDADDVFLPVKKAP